MTEPAISTGPAIPKLGDGLVASQIVDGWFNLILKIVLTALLATALLRPDFLPIVSRLTANLVDVEFYGAKFHFDQDATKALEKRGIEIKDGAILVGGRDIVQVVGDKAKLEGQIKVLADENTKLQASLAAQTDLLDKTRQQLSSASGAGGVDLGAFKTEIAAAAATVDKVVSQSKAAVTQATKTAEEVSQPNAGASLPAVGYALVFSSDTSLDDALNEVKKAPGVTSNPIIIYHRRNYLASAAYFGTKDAALAALPAFAKEWPKNGPFVVAIGTWCPQPTLVQSASPTSPEQMNCGF